MDHNLYYLYFYIHEQLKYNYLLELKLQFFQC
nr:MAG TPA: hypothetical protein [Caudoviricetes sp.]